MKKHRVFGRLKRVGVGDDMYTFELVKDELDPKTFMVAKAGGVRVRRFRSRTSFIVDFSSLVGGGGYHYGGAVFTSTSDGLMIRPKGSRLVNVIRWDQLLNLAHKQPKLIM
jgi:hypothetical protein